MIVYKQPVSVLVVIYTAALEVLLLERADHAGYWQSVTGSRETGETYAETAAREVMEETGISVANFQLRDMHKQNQYEIYPQWRHRYAPGVTQNTEHVFTLCLPHQIAVSISTREHLDYRWLPWQDAAELVFSPSNRETILQIAQISTSNHIEGDTRSIDA